MKEGIIILLALLLFSCNQRTFDSKEELLQYITNPKSGYLQKKSVNGIDISLMYRPTDLLVDQELRGLQDKKTIDSLRDKYDNYLYFNLSLSKNNEELLSTVPKNRNEFGAIVNQLAFGMDQKIHLYTRKKDTIPMLDYVYPRMYGMSDNTSLLLVYPRNEDILKEETLTLSIEDFGAQIGEVKFKIVNKTFIKEPKILFQNNEKREKDI